MEEMIFYALHKNGVNTKANQKKKQKQKIKQNKKDEEIDKVKKKN